MPKEIVVSALMNRILYATTNGKGLITGKKEDITDACIKAMFQHMMEEHKRHKKDNNESFGYAMDGIGELHFYPADKEDVDNEQLSN